eukprot:1309740-Pleurochrysis_carterae.AAC.1
MSTWRGRGATLMRARRANFFADSLRSSSAQLSTHSIALTSKRSGGKSPSSLRLLRSQSKQM